MASWHNQEGYPPEEGYAEWESGYAPNDGSYPEDPRLEQQLGDLSLYTEEYPDEHVGSNYTTDVPPPEDDKGKTIATETSQDWPNEATGGLENAGYTTDNQFGDEAYGLSAVEQQNVAQAMAESRSSAVLLHPYAGAYQGESSASGAYAAANLVENSAIGQFNPTADPYGGEGYHETETFDDNTDGEYLIYPSRDWEFGCMFLIYWSEPRGKTNDSTWTHKKKTRDGEGNVQWEGPRRFVIISRDHKGGNSTCVPVTTYQGRGLKRGAKPKCHGIVHDATKEPVPMEGEPTLGYKPVAIDMWLPGASLTPTSRINYSKLQTVEHNLCILFLGKVSEKHIELFKKHAKRALDR